MKRECGIPDIAVSSIGKIPVSKAVDNDRGKKGNNNQLVCPDCGVGMIRLGSCFTCPACGHGGCG